MIEHELILQLFGQDASIDLLTRLLRELKAEKNSLSPLSVADIIVDAVECLVVKTDIYRFKYG